MTGRPEGAPTRPPKRPRRRTPSRLGDRLFRGVTAAVAASLAGIFIAVVVLLLESSRAAIEQYGAGFLWGTQFYPQSDVYGALPFVAGTLLTSALALLIAIPVSLGIAVFLSEQAPDWLRLPLSALVDLLAAVPSVVYGLWAFLVLVPYMQFTAEPWLKATFPGNPLFAGPAAGQDVLTAGVVLSIMVIPTISALSREAMRSVPQHQREAALSLGLTRWETTRMSVLKYARSGIFGAIVLGLGRAVGETMAVTMTIGNINALPTSLLSPGQSMASLIALDLNEPGIDPSVIMEIALLLLVITILINVGARLMVWRLARREGIAA